MTEIAGVVESLEVFRVFRQAWLAWEFHVHWTATRGGFGCTTKLLSVDTIRASRFTTLARFGLSEQALTGNPVDSLKVKLIVNLQRAPGLEVKALMSLPGSRHQLEITVKDEEPNHQMRPLNGRLTQHAIDDWGIGIKDEELPP